MMFHEVGLKFEKSDVKKAMELHHQIQSLELSNQLNKWMKKETTKTNQSVEVPTNYVGAMFHSIQ